MQRYSVNVPLLVGLVVGALVLSGAGVGLYFYQKSQNTEALLRQAEQAREAGDLREERSALKQYIRKRPEDAEAAVRLVEVVKEVAKLPDAESSERGEPFGITEYVLRLHPDEKEVRRQLVDDLMQGSSSVAYARALDHINHLLLTDPKNAELHDYRLQALYGSGKDGKAEKLAFKLIGYDRATDTFDVEQAVLPDRASFYARAATAILKRDVEPELADRLMDQLVEANPDQPQAHLVRGQYLIQRKREDEGREEIANALELGPDNVDALMAKASLILSDASEKKREDRDFDLTPAIDEAFTLLEAAQKADATDMRVYTLMARLARQQGDTEAMVAHYDAGIAAVDELERLQLLFAKARALLDYSDAERAQKAIKELEKIGANPMLVDYLEARLLEARSEWFKASEEYARLKPLFSNVGVELQSDLYIHLGNCYDKLGQYERALDAFQQVLQITPSNIFAKAKVAEIGSRFDKAAPAESEQGVTKLVVDELRKPADEQNWAPVFKAARDYADRINLDPGRAKLIEAEIYTRRGKYKEAQIAVKEATDLSGEFLGVWRQAFRIVARDPSRGPAVALSRMSKLIDKFGDQPILRLDKADYLIAIGDENISEQLEMLAEGIDDWSNEDKIRLWKELAKRFSQVRDQENAERYLAKVVELSPNEMQPMLSLFRSAITRGDVEGVKSAQAKVLNLVGSKDNATYLFTEATRTLWGVQRGAVERTQLEQAEKLVERALLQRRDWHELHLLEARIHLAKGERTAALASFDMALQKGPADPLAMLQHVGLLLERGRYVDANAALEKISPTLRQRLFGRRYAGILLNVGSVNEAIASADAVAERGAENGATQLWYGRFNMRLIGSPSLTKSDREAAKEKAEAALRKSVELSPDNPDGWLMLVEFLAKTEGRDAAELALRKAQLMLPDDQASLVLASSYPKLGRWFDAEQTFLRLRSASPENTRVARLLADFYLGQLYRRPDKNAKATPLLNEILQSAADDPEKKNNPDVLWARREAAKLLASSNDYQKLLTAENLLASNVVDGSLSEPDKLLLARILSGRPEPSSRRKAIALLEEIQRNRVLELEDDLRLGQLYYATQDWEACQIQMLETIARNRNIPAPRQRYIAMLLQRGGPADLDAAMRQLKRLQESFPGGRIDDTTWRLIVQVAAKSGQKRQASAALKQLIPKDLKKAENGRLLMVAGLLTTLGDLDNAEKFYRGVAARQPNTALYLADFLGTYRDPAESFEVLDKIAKETSIQAAIRGGLLVARARRDDIGDSLDGKLQGWLDKAIREEPESIPLQIQLAEFRDIQQRYDDAAAVYRKLLERSDLRGGQRAVVLNNLSYLLALQADSQAVAEEAFGYVMEAIDILGPQADILDTRAVAHIALKQYDAAASDLALSLTDSPTASKYFHKAQAHMLAGDTDKALEAWNNANRLGLTRESLAPAEKPRYDELEAKVDATAERAAG